MGEARERSVADLGYSNAQVSRKVMEAYDVLNIIRTKNGASLASIEAKIQAHKSVS